MSALATIISTATPRRVPDHDGLAASISEKIVGFTWVMVPGDKSDRSKIRFIACAGRRNGAWVVKVVRIPFSTPDATLLDLVRPHWQMVAAFPWDTPSHQIAADMVSAYGDRPGFMRNRIEEWIDRFTDKE